MDCNEIFLNEVTHVELVASSVCTIPVPSNAKAVTELSGCTIGRGRRALPSAPGAADFSESPAGFRRCSCSASSSEQRVAFPRRSCDHTFPPEVCGA